MIIFQIFRLFTCDQFLLVLFRDIETHSAGIQELLKEHKLACMKPGDPNEIIVWRTKLLESTFRDVKSKNFDCCKQLIVQFSGEDAIDAGGLEENFLGTA